MAIGMSGRTVIVTGAASGVGLAVARRFARAGARVMMADIDDARLRQEAEGIESEGLDGEVLTFHGDLTERLNMANLMASAIDAFEGIHVLVNAARSMVAGDALSADSDQFETAFQRNVVAPLRLSQIAARRMIEYAGEEVPAPVDRSIINLSSVIGTRAMPELLSYSVSCAAIEQLTRGLAVVLAPHRIRVNAVAAGGVVGSGMREALPEAGDLHDAMARVTPLGPGEQTHVADAAVFLASPSSGHTTGEVLTVDGGRRWLDPLAAALE